MRLMLWPYWHKGIKSTSGMEIGTFRFSLRVP